MSPKDPIIEFNRRLLIVHRALLDKARRGLEARNGRPIAPLEFFNLLRTETSLQWLQPLMSLIVEADTLTDKKYELQPDDVAKLKARFGAELFSVPSESPPESLAARYQAQIQNDSDLAKLHLEMLEVFERL